MSVTWLDEIDDAVLAEKKVLCRVDFNVPLDDKAQVLDGLRVEYALPTLRRLIRARAKVVLLSHLGRPKGKPKPSLSLEPVADYLRDLLNQEITFVHDCVGDGVSKIINDSAPGSVVFLENVRFHKGEEKNDAVFAKMLAKNCDIFVNDAFGALHREHASVSGLKDHCQKMIGGMLLKKEVTAFENIIRSPKKPLVAVIGGAKVSSKIGVLTNLLKKVDTLIIGGAMAYTFLRAQGQNVGASLVEENKISLAANLLSKAAQLGVEVKLPVDHVVASNVDGSDRAVVDNGDFASDQIGFDLGPRTITAFGPAIEDAKTIFFNGPMGMCEHERFATGTDGILKIIAAAKGYSIVGGGDSIAALNKSGLLKEIDFVSSGGGASLEFLEGKKLPGLMALGYYDN